LGGHLSLRAGVAVLLLLAATTGCLQDDDGGDGAKVVVDLSVEFGPEAPAAHAGKVAEWTPADDNWSLSLVNSTDGGTVYIVRGVTASTAMGALLAGGTVAQFEVRHRTEAMGAFVESVAGVENGHDGRYWSYYIDDEYGTVASDRAQLSSGQTVRWVYLGGPGG
jgi:hypothetical protein